MYTAVLTAGISILPTNTKQRSHLVHFMTSPSRSVTFTRAAKCYRLHETRKLDKKKHCHLNTHRH
jgi:hypothetical protein